MSRIMKALARVAVPVCLIWSISISANSNAVDQRRTETEAPAQRPRVSTHSAIAHDLSHGLGSFPANSGSIGSAACTSKNCDTPQAEPESPQQRPDPPTPELPEISSAGAAVEQTSQGKHPPIAAGDSFDGLGTGFEGPQGTAQFRNPSDNSLAAGPDNIVQIVNSRLAVFTKKGARYDTTGKVLYGPVVTNAIFAGFGGVCEARNNGDAVVRYDQLAGRWLIVMPIFRRIAPGEYPELTKPGGVSSPGAAAAPPANPPQPAPPPGRGQGPTGSTNPAPASPLPGTYAMCYAVSTTSDPLGPYYRYAFERPLFPDYPRPAVWPDGYYVPTSTGDDVIQKHVCIADRNKMLKGEPATEQCIVIDGVNFLNNSDVDGMNQPPAGAPNIMMAAGGTQLKKIFEDDGIFYWKVHVDWANPANTKADGPHKISVAPYHYLCNGQLSSCVPQPGTDRHLDVQGDKIMQRLVYRRIGKRESIVAAHSIATKAGAGGVRWYEFRLDKNGDPQLFQQGTYAPDKFYRFMPSIGMDAKGDIGVGYSFGGTPNFVGQRFAARQENDPKGRLGLQETILANGEAAQANTLRWEDYTTTAMDPSDDCTFWYVGDYLKQGETNYRTRIGSFRVPSCKAK